MRTLLDRKNISSRTNGQVAARRVTGLIIRRLWLWLGMAYGYMPIIIIHCGRDRGICAHRINKTCFMHALTATATGTATATATATGAWLGSTTTTTPVYAYGCGRRCVTSAAAVGVGPSQAPVHAPNINLFSDYLRIRHCHTITWRSDRPTATGAWGYGLRPTLWLRT